MQLTIHDIAFGGKGVGRSEGLVVFVPFVIPGETVSVELTRKKKNYAEATLASIETPSPDRTKPQCVMRIYKDEAKAKEAEQDVRLLMGWPGRKAD